MAAGALVVAAGVALLLGNTVQLSHSADASVRATRYVSGVVNVERLVVDVETGLRGYVITRHEEFLAPTRFARAALPAAMDELRRVAHADGHFEAQTAALLATVRPYLNAYVPDVLALVRTRPQTARSLVVTVVGKQQVDAIRAQTATLEREVSASQTARQHAAHSSAASSISEAIVILALLTLLTIGLGAFLGNLVVTRGRARRRSARTTETLQQSLLPASVPSIQGCELAVRFLPAEGELVGGDFYDVFPSGTGRWTIVLGDVCGKGAAAATMSAMARWTLRSNDDPSMTPAAALHALNRAMLRHVPQGRFITVAYVSLTMEPSGARASVACAGHPPPVVVPAEGDPTPVGAAGDLLGVWSSVRLHATEVLLAPGDSLVLYTDGVTDQGPKPRRAPHEALRDRPSAASADQLAEIVEHLARDRAGPHHDDIAILAVRCLTGSLSRAGTEERTLTQAAGAA